MRALSIVFRAKYREGLQRAFDTGQVTFAGGTADLSDRQAFTRFLGPLRAVDWVVYAKRPFAGPEQVLEYLGRYTHRVALSNDRLVDHVDGRVRFHWKDYADHHRPKVMTLDAEEFLRRFLLHVVPKGFMRIRHFGLLANRARRAHVARGRDLLGQPPPRGGTTRVGRDAPAAAHRRRPGALRGLRRGPDADHGDRGAPCGPAGHVMRARVRYPTTVSQRRTQVRSVVLCLVAGTGPAPAGRRRTPSRVPRPSRDALRAHACTPRSHFPSPHARAAIQSP